MGRRGERNTIFVPNCRTCPGSRQSIINRSSGLAVMVTGVLCGVAQADRSIRAAKLRCIGRLDTNHVHACLKRVLQRVSKIVDRSLFEIQEQLTSPTFIECTDYAMAYEPGLAKVPELALKITLRLLAITQSLQGINGFVIVWFDSEYKFIQGNGTGAWR